MIDSYVFWPWNAQKRCLKRCVLTFLLIGCALVTCNATRTVAQPVPGPPEYALEVLEMAVPVAPTIALPDLDAYTDASIKSMTPNTFEGKVTLVSAEGEECLSESFGGKQRRAFNAMQGGRETRVIKIVGGAMSLQQVVHQVGDPTIAELDGNAVILRLPLLVGADATLVIRGDETVSLRMVTAKGTLLANLGTLLILDAEVSSWDEATQQPTPCSEDGKSFCPFVTAFAGSKTYVTGSHFHDLGYLSPSAYGFSLTAHPHRNTPETSGNWPTGTIVGSTFERLFYGFYSFEAKDVAIVGNKYIDNIRYGIDPHDRSTRLTIAKNIATGTQEKHGIIGSRGITDSFIVDNVSYANNGTGIMLDRQCARNVVANNRIYDNGSSGVAIYESPDNVITGNLIAFNQGTGFRVRNSRELLLQDNLIVGNEGFAVSCESKTLDDHEERVARGDTYEAQVGLDVFDNALVANLDGLFKGRNVTSLKVGAVRTRVDMEEVNRMIGGEKRQLGVEDDDPLGGDLDAFLGAFDKVIDSSSHVLHIQTKEQ